MFKAITSEVSLLKDSIDTISELIGEGVFKLKKDGISLLAADRAMVGVVNFELKKESFEEYKCDEETSIGINIENLLQILKRAKSNDKVTLELEENKLKIKIEGESTRRFSIPLLDISVGEIPEIEQLDFQAELKMKTSVMEEGIEDADIISDSMILQTKEGKFIMKTEGNSSKVEIEVDKDGGIKEISGDDVKSRYALDYLKKMMGGGKLSDIVSLKFGKDFPIKLIFQKPEKVSMSFVLAPRVED